MTARPLIPGIRLLYLAGTGLALGAAFMTYVLTSHTDDYFAWPIAPDISAAFLGGCYCTAVTLLYLSSQATTWVQGRLAAVPVMSISVLLLVATVVHWDKFDHDHFVFWLWLAAYVLVPPVLLFLIFRQLREPGEDPVPARPPAAGTRAGMAVHAFILLMVGAILFFATGTAQDFWPWALTPLTSRAIGAFTIGFGLAAAGGLLEGDLDRLYAPALAYAVLGAAQLIVVARYPDEFDLDAVGWIYLAFFATVLLGGVAVALLARRSNAEVASA